MGGEGLRVAADGGRGRDHQVADEAVHGGAPGDFLGRGLLGYPIRSWARPGIPWSLR
jgi:hypothetical protein